MSVPPLSPEILEEIRAVQDLYQALAPAITPQQALGGQLLFAGKLDTLAMRLMRAANISGAASLAVSASPETVRLAIRSGAADFIVTSLDEAIRILKNEIRKKLPVAVVIQAEPVAVGHEMLLRGLQPNLLTASVAAAQPLCARTAFLERGATLLEAVPEDPHLPLHIWPIPAAWNARMPELDRQLGELLPETAAAARRWLRLAPRYLGHEARKLRSVACDMELAAKLEQCIYTTVN